MIFLGVESSCDETSIGLVEKKGNSYSVLANKIITQASIHKKYGGIVPEIAARAHVDVIDLAIKETLNEHKINKQDIDVISSTSGPGLVGGLLVGTLAAKALAIGLQKPYLPINHLHGHALSPRIENKLEFPYLLLLISGGNCLMVLVKNELDCQIIGRTIDDAPGEAFDKVARMLNLGYPGGPKIEEMAEKAVKKDIVFPVPLQHSKDLNFSFSGLKTAVLNKISKLQNIAEQDVHEICYSFQDSVAKSLAGKVNYAIENTSFAFGKKVAIAGGVSANNYIANKIKDKIKDKGFSFAKPSLQYCVDNGAMVAYAASQIYSFDNKIIDNDFINTKVNPRWSLDNLREFYTNE